MTNIEAKQLEVGQRVSWDGNPADLGTVTQTAIAGLYVEWDNGLRGWMDYRGMALIQKAAS